MDEGQVEGFVAAAERDYRCAIDGYCSILAAEWHWDVGELREARADVLAAHEVLLLAQTELHRVTVGYRPATEQSGSIARLPIGESGQWLERGEGEAER